MQPYRYDIKKFLLISGTIGILSNSAFSWLTTAMGLPYGFSIGFATSVIGLFWVLFDQFLWRWKIFQMLGVSDLPNLNGLWVGDVDRLGEMNPHRFEMLIFQTYSKISIQTNSRNSKGNSLHAAFLCDETRKNFDIVNYWVSRTKTRNIKKSHEETFTGLSRIDVRRRDGEIVLEDYYFTDRTPHTRGKVLLHRVPSHSVVEPTSGAPQPKVGWFRRIFGGSALKNSRYEMAYLDATSAPPPEDEK